MSFESPKRPSATSASALNEHANALDQTFNAMVGRVTNGQSPAGAASLWFSWLAHMAMAPGKRLELAFEAIDQAMAVWAKADDASNPGIENTEARPWATDHRFGADAWRRWPFDFVHRSFLATQNWWRSATTEIDGLSEQEEEMLFFLTRQVLDRWSPSNFLWSNPELLAATADQGGANLARGAVHALEDAAAKFTGHAYDGRERFRPGETVAVTPGQVVFRNEMIELIQYEPATRTVHPEPVLIVPAWIMKFYILDLSPHNSLVRYLVEQGRTVFVVSWRNPNSEHRDWGMEDYRREGLMAALDTVSAITPDQKVHAAGYCLGGTLLGIGAAAMARDGDDRLASITNFAAQFDFTEAGELLLLLNDSEVSFLEHMMAEKGYLDGAQMAGAFQLLRSHDLIWSRILRNYLLGERDTVNDLMAWNADVTRMPARMHSEYLRKLFLNNDLAAGRYLAEGRPVQLADIRAPIFAVGTVKDHVSPWKSVYKITVHPATDVTFVLASGGHNAGIVSEPGHPRRSYQIATDRAGDMFVDPDAWRARTPVKQGSWWTEWVSWLAERSGEPGPPPSMGAPKSGLAPLGPAPGDYVHET